ncbi:MAG: GNAT family N-acetyltransferase [Thiomonas arsenitoxydans]|uniref:GNAT family N-acetyltransferase n=2 Tax=Burkholderiales genera incertae sedis TaxID=224471 RepID=A0A8I1SW82_THIA3|nr:GNAT family N-acetyltransferase [Thiomonas arsenitoxydans]ODU98410.1 MAG: GNAT family N-acetyltransferase [Thiomonas sp. SCN 64-16]
MPPKATMPTDPQSTAALGQPVPGFTAPPPPARAALIGATCTLEPADPQRHAADLYAAQTLDARGDGWNYLPYGPFASAFDYQAWMQATCLGQDPLFFAIVDSGTGRATGLASYLRITPAAGSIEIGHLYFSPLLQRRRAATEALFLLMDQAFALGYRRLEWKCNALNAASREAARRLGFSFEGVFRQAAVVKGRNRDTAWFSIIDGEWPALRAAFTRWLAAENFDEKGRQRERLSALTTAALRGAADDQAE